MTRPVSPIISVPALQADAINATNTYKKVVTSLLQGETVSANDWVDLINGTGKVISGIRDLAQSQPNSVWGKIVGTAGGPWIELTNKTATLVETYSDTTRGLKDIAVSDLLSVAGALSDLAARPLLASVAFSSIGVGFKVVSLSLSVAQIAVGEGKLGDYGIGVHIPVNLKREVLQVDSFSDGKTVIMTIKNNETGQTEYQRFYENKLVATTIDLGNGNFLFASPTGGSATTMTNNVNDPRAVGRQIGGTRTTAGQYKPVDFAVDGEFESGIQTRIYSNGQLNSGDPVELALSTLSLENGTNNLLIENNLTSALAGKDLTGAFASYTRDDGFTVFLANGESIAVNRQGQIRQQTIASLDDGGRRIIFTEFDGSSVIRSESATGIVEIVNKDSLQRITGKEVRYPTIDAKTELYDSNNELIATKTQQFFDDVDGGQSRLMTVTYPSGYSEVLATDTAGNPARLLITTPTGNNTETIETYGYSADGKAQLQSSRAVEYFEDANGRSHIDTLTTYGSGEPVVTRVVYNPDGSIASSEVVVPPASAANTVTIDGIAALNDIAGLISAIQNGKPLPILGSGLHLLNTLSGGTVPNIANANSIVSGLSSLYNLHNTLAHSGNTLGKINATLSTLNYVNSTLPALLNAGPLSNSLNTVLNGSGTVFNAAKDGLITGGNFNGLLNGGTPGVLPVLGLIISIKNGDPIGTVSGIIGLLNPAWLAGPVGWILAGASILNALFNNKAPPEAWGSAKFILDANGHITIDTVGESFGKDRVSQQLGYTLNTLNYMIAQVQAVSPNTLLGLIAQRTPTLSWREARQSDKGYALIDIDPVTGQQRYPYLRFDDNGVPFSSNPQGRKPSPLGSEKYYAFDSCSRIFHAGYRHKTYLKEAANDAGWRVAA